MLIKFFLSHINLQNPITKTVAASERTDSTRLFIKYSNGSSDRLQ